MANPLTLLGKQCLRCSQALTQAQHIQRLPSSPMLFLATHYGHGGHGTQSPVYRPPSCLVRDHTTIVHRKYPLPVGPDGGLPTREQLNELHKILLEVETIEYPTTMKCILTQFVDGIGIRGDLVQVERDLFHDELYPLGKAVYASPENLSEFDEERKAKGIDKAELRLGVYARMTMSELSKIHLNIPLSETESWTLTPQHVQVAFRTQGVELDISCIKLPEDPITKFEEVKVTVWINNLESVDVNATIVPIAERFPQISKK